MRRLLSCVLALGLLAGCASAPRTPVDAQLGPWSGRLALQVQDNASQSFTAAFELKGTAREGELALFDPLGNTVALMTWLPDSATLTTNGETRQFRSVNSLVASATGSALPVAALFDWLRGIETPVAGWQADLSQLAQGRLSAQRLQPPPLTELRLVLER